MNTLWWIRSDLRINDNRALREACSGLSDGDRVYAVYYATPAQWLTHDMAPVQIAWIEQRLPKLAKQLADIGVELIYESINCFADCAEALSHLCEQYQIDAVYANAEPEIDERNRDKACQTSLELAGRQFNVFDEHCILPPGSVVSGSGEMYRVFTPFRKAWIKEYMQRHVDALPILAPESTGIDVKSTLDEQFQFPWFDDYCIHLSEALCDGAPSTKAQRARMLASQWVTDEADVYQQLQDFIHHQVEYYAEQRDFPALTSTSLLSPYLALGMISARQCLHELLGFNPHVMEHKEQRGFTWLNEIVWREFYRHLIVWYPSLCQSSNFLPAANQLCWESSLEDLRAWCRGETGYPLVDAAMKQLVETGWMHNRLRMVVASFLTKHLLIDWRHGERFFRQHLIDGDLAANNGGWQWAASTGCDGQPYFRVFNPITQSERFDPEGKFIKQYLPELEKADKKSIHFPGPFLYIKPIVDHKFARARAIERFEQVMKKPAQN